RIDSSHSTAAARLRPTGSRRSCPAIAPRQATPGVRNRLRYLQRTCTGWLVPADLEEVEHGLEALPDRLRVVGLGSTGGDLLDVGRDFRGWPLAELGSPVRPRKALTVQ